MIGRALVAASLLGSLLVRPARAQLDDAITVGQPAPAFAIADLDGQRVALDTVLGRRPVLLEFWATWCTSCQAMLPALRALHREFGDRVSFIGVNVTISETLAGVREYAVTHELPFQVLYDSDGEAARAYDPPATSYIVVIDGAGRVAYTGLGGAQRLTSVLRGVTSSSP